VGYPEGFLWEYPGFPSLTVCYLKTNDFFYSGHVGFPVLAALEFSRHGKSGMAYFALFTMCLETMVMIVTRVHYIVDLLCGMIIAHYIYRIVDDYVHYVDNSWVSLGDGGKRDARSSDPVELQYVVQENNMTTAGSK
jgi:hypothetical protein